MPKNNLDTATSARLRSAPSELIPNPGPGYFLNTRETKSLYRCYRAAIMLLRKKNAVFARNDWRYVRRHLNPNSIKNIVIWYWYRHNFDKSIRDSELKRDLKKFVTHLGPLVNNISKLRPETKRILNRAMAPPTMFQPKQEDVISEIERLNGEFLAVCKPLVLADFIKGGSTSVREACNDLTNLWESIFNKDFKYNSRVVPSGERKKLTTDAYEFENRGMHFIHVLLQAIDPKITYSQVRNGVREARKQNRRDAIAQKSKR